LGLGRVALVSGLLPGAAIPTATCFGQIRLLRTNQGDHQALSHQRSRGRGCGQCLSFIGLAILTKACWSCLDQFVRELADFAARWRRMAQVMG
jgi:hypothetical protein